MSILTYKYRIKDSQHRAHLTRQAWAVHTVWNYCNEVSMLAYRRDRKWLTGFDLNNLTSGCAALLGISSTTVQAVCEEYAKRRKQHKKFKLSWRSRKRSLGWIPFKANSLKLVEDVATYCGRSFRLWLSRPIGGKIKTGCFTQDSRGRWYICFVCEVPDTEQISLALNPIGIDLGLKDTLALSTGDKFTRENITRENADKLAIAQRAHKKKRVAAIQAKIANTRRDWSHKTTSQIVAISPHIYVGDVSSTKLVKTRMAKSVYDAGWGMLRNQLEYKANRLAGFAVSTREAFSSVTCSDCLERTGPSGLSALGVREWQCSKCEAIHDRDTNAALNILRMGRHTPIKGIPIL